MNKEIEKAYILTSIFDLIDCLYFHSKCDFNFDRTIGKLKGYCDIYKDANCFDSVIYDCKHDVYVHDDDDDDDDE